MSAATTGLTCDIAGPGARCTIHVLGYENPTAQDPSDANWLSCCVSLRCDRFSAECPAAFSTQDFGALAEELRTVLGSVTGAASFHADEEVLSLSINLGRTGNASVSGVLRLPGSTHGMLSFSFESDQTYLSETLRHLEALTRTFPARLGSPRT